MAAAGVSLTDSQKASLDEALRPHLRLEPDPRLRPRGPPSADPEGGRGKIGSGEEERAGLGAGVSRSGDTERRRGISALMMEQNKQQQQRTLVSVSHGGGTAMQMRSSKVLYSTVEADNKRRPAVSKRNSLRYQPPSPEPPDPNSEAKSVTIRRMQGSLEEWEKELEDICEKKARNDSLHRQELQRRELEMSDMTGKYQSERELRDRTEGERDRLDKALKETEEELINHKGMVEQLQIRLAEYEAGYKQSEENRLSLEQEYQETSEQLQKSENMRRRLQDQVTELQGQLAIEEQRSRFCTLL